MKKDKELFENEIFEVNMKKPVILSPAINSVVRHTGFRHENNENYPCDVFIINGAYLSNGRVSNFWYWKRVLPNGDLGEIECGYGSFEESDNEYEVEITIKVKKL